MTKKLVVKKFGGTSVGDVSRIRNVAKLVAEYIRRTGDKTVVVVSAMSGETNRLIALAKSCVNNPDPRELDVMVATGEQVTIALTAMALNELGLPAKSFTATQAQISTDRNFTKAQIREIAADNLMAALDEGIIPVVAGFQGVDELGDITTLGRGGSDITAVAVAAALKAHACYIYTDVCGVYSTDPRICPSAKLLPQVSHEEMLEMASLGAKVLHPRSVYFAMAYHIPLAVLSTFEPDRGITWIVREEELMEKPIVTGVTYRTDEAKITIQKLPAEPNALSKIFSALSDENIYVDMITQTGFDGRKTDISFTVLDEDSSKALAIVDRLIPLLKAEGACCDRNIAKISVVGVGMRYHTGVASRAFEALAREGIEVQMISTSEIKISVLVPRKYWEVAVRSLHEAFYTEATPAVETRA
jgi:aspartate kinase